MREIIHHTQVKSRHPTYLIALDIQKAFDSVDHQYLVQTLEKFGYGPTFINVMNNGYMTRDIELQGGLRQGCPLSLILYCIVAETLANEIRANIKIQGHNAPGTHEAIKISQYADDTILITSDINPIRHTLSSFDTYYRATGCKLKRSKLKGLIVGHNTTPPTTLEQITWVNDIGLKILGVTFFNDPLYTINYNWTVVVTKLIAKLNHLRYRPLSLRGKAIILNTYQSHARGKTDDTIFRILHKSYPTGAKMKNSRQKGNFNPNCKYCIKQGKTKLETTLHVFAACSFVMKIWQHYKIIYTTLQPNTPFRYENIVLTINLTLNPTPKPTCKLLLTVTSFTLTELWTARNKFRFDRLVTNHQRSTRTINTNISYMLNTHYKHHMNLNTLSIFQDTFLINNALGNIGGNKLNITLP